VLQFRWSLWAKKERRFREYSSGKDGTVEKAKSGGREGKRGERNAAARGALHGLRPNTFRKNRKTRRHSLYFPRGIKAECQD